MRRGAWVCAALPTLLIALPSRATEDVCPLHGIKMTRKEVPIVYGMPSQAEFEEMKVAKEKFPFGREYKLGGCILKPQKTTKAHVCEKCVAARNAWLKNRKDRR